MKSPDEIKKGLECCSNPDGTCEGCPYVEGECRAFEQLSADALALIQQLEAQNAELSGKIGRLEGKLGEAINDLHRAVNCPATLVACEFCKNNEVCPHDGTCDAVENDRWQWRGSYKEGK